MMRLKLPGAVLALALSAAACTGPAPPPPAAQPPPQPAAVALPPQPLPPPSAPVVGAIPPAQVPAAVASLQTELARRLKPQTSSGAVAITRSPDGGAKLSFDALRAFEPGSAQLRPEMLTRLADCAAAIEASGGFVVHLVGYGPDAPAPDIESLAERRATTAAAYLLSRGAAPGRVRAEGRVLQADDQAQRLELVFEPIVEGRELLAWMPPSMPALK